MDKKELKTKLAAEVGNLIGHLVGSDHVHTDETGWYGYIPAKSLERYHPLVLVHYRGPLFMIIPTDDWEDLLHGIITTDDYIIHATWGFGQYQGGIGQTSWESFDSHGITSHDTVSRFLRETNCKVAHWVNNYTPPTERCDVCLAKESCAFQHKIH